MYHFTKRSALYLTSEPLWIALKFSDVQVIHDITCLATEVSGDYLVHVLRLLSSCSTEILVLVKQSILDGGKSLSTTLPLVINTIIEGLVEKAVEVSSVFSRTVLNIDYAMI
ncbi:hypothetical protein Pint_21671 [Pistacia integerrima]|uniref:Uncharacterized protein n=1 Tax=Pistacia integerrima TaxID=434235 RepID=A0ACC0XAG9_9ROSI|nr:hypothetical protein Pint_21671 [Pistacia integerrima]